MRMMAGRSPRAHSTTLDGFSTAVTSDAAQHQAGDDVVEHRHAPAAKERQKATAKVDKAPLVNEAQLVREHDVHGPAAFADERRDDEGLHCSPDEGSRTQRQIGELRSAFAAIRS